MLTGNCTFNTVGLASIFLCLLTTVLPGLLYLLLRGSARRNRELRRRKCSCFCLRVLSYFFLRMVWICWNVFWSLLTAGLGRGLNCWLEAEWERTVKTARTAEQRIVLTNIAATNKHSLSLSLSLVAGSNKIKKPACYYKLAIIVVTEWLRRRFLVNWLLKSEECRAPVWFLHEMVPTWLTRTCPARVFCST